MAGFRRDFDHQGGLPRGFRGYVPAWRELLALEQVHRHMAMNPDIVRRIASTNPAFVFPERHVQPPRLRLGTRFEASHLRLGVELAGEHREGGADGPEQTVRLDLRLRL